MVVECLRRYDHLFLVSRQLGFLPNSSSLFGSHNFDDWLDAHMWDVELVCYFFLGECHQHLWVRSAGYPFIKGYNNLFECWINCQFCHKFYLWLNFVFDPQFSSLQNPDLSLFREPDLSFSESTFWQLLEVLRKVKNLSTFEPFLAHLQILI